MGLSPASLWRIPDRPPTKPGCFVVLSYALHDRHLPTAPTRAEIELAVQWWRRFPDARIILSTGDNQHLGVTNARVMADYAASLGVPRRCLIEEGRSRNTLENLVNSGGIIEALAIRQPTIVALDLYTRRAVAIARKLGWRDFYWLSVYARGEPAHGIKRWQTWSRGTIFLYEFLAYLYGKVAGWQ